MEKTLMKFLGPRALEEIGFDYIMNSLSPLTPYGQKLKRNLHCFASGEEQQLNLYLQNIQALKEHMLSNGTAYKDISACMCKLKDISGSLKLCLNSGILDEVELFEIKSFAIRCLELERLWTFLPLSKIINSITFKDITGVLKLLDPEGKGLPTFFLYDSYSPLLKEIRHRKKAVEAKLFTCPQERLEELKAIRLQIVNEELLEELKIKEELSSRLIAFIEPMQHNMASIGELDMLIAKAQVASLSNCCIPRLEASLGIEMMEGVNPYIASILKSRGKSFKGVTISLQQGATVITGANMGGKTVALKTLALNTLLVHLGFLPFASCFTLSLLDFIYISSESSQQVSRGLSSFASEIYELNEALAHIDKEKGLILLDEFARGTNPKEGYILCSALISYLNPLQVLALITTHYDGVASYAKAHYECRGLKNVNLSELSERVALSKDSSVHIIQDYMDFTLERIYSHCFVPKDALNICRLLGFKEEVLKEAEKYYNKEDFDEK